MPETKEKSSIGIDANIAAALSYVAGFITGIIFFVLERKSKFVKFHAMQSIIVFGALFIIFSILPVLGIFHAAIYNILRILSLVIWILLIIKAYRGEQYKLPFVGEIAEKNCK